VTPTNTEIYIALSQILDAGALGYPVSKPGGVAFNGDGTRMQGGFTPPDEGIWLEVEFQPNSGIDNGLAADDDVIPNGSFTIMVMARPSVYGIFPVSSAAGDVAALYPKNKTLSGLVRVSRSPQLINLPKQSDRFGIMVSVPYSG